MAAFGAEEHALRAFLTESRMMVAAATVKCAGCNFAVTGLTKSHCCVLCQRTPGKRGPRCERRLRKCKNCDYAVTMADCPHHCCKLCARGEEEHGPRCQRMAMPMSDDELDEDDDAPDPELDLKIVDNMTKMEQNEAMIRALREKLGL